MTTKPSEAGLIQINDGLCAIVAALNRIAAAQEVATVSHGQMLAMQEEERQARREFMAMMMSHGMVRQ